MQVRLFFLFKNSTFFFNKRISSTMSQNQNYVNKFPIENFSLNNIQLTILILGLVEFLLLNLLIDTKKVYNFCSGFRSHLIRADDSEDHAKTNGSDFAPSIKQEKRDDQSVSGGEIDIVLKSLGMSSNSYEARLDENDIFNLFEEKNPSLDEIKEAFDVFDDNRDGFIDAKELQKVMCALGFKEGLEMENCRRMIGVFDENGDGRIDFDEFVKFMEVSLC